MSLRFKLVCLVSLVALITGLIMTSHVRSYRAESEHAAEASLLQTATVTSRLLDCDLRQRYADVQAFAQNRAAYSPSNWRKPVETNPLVASMNRYMLTYSGYALSMLVAPDGRVLAVNSRDHAGKPLDTQALYDENFSEALWFKDAKNGKFLEGSDGLSGTTIIGPYNDKHIASLTGEDGLVLTFSAQVTNDADQLIGIWVNFMPFDVAEKTIGDMYGMLKSAGLPRTAITLLDNKGVVLVDYDPAVQGAYKRNYSVIGKLNMMEAGVEAVAKAINGKGDGVESVHHPVTRPLLIDAYSYSHGAGDFPGFGWTVLVRGNSDELFSAANTLERALTQTAWIIGAVVFIAAWLSLPKLARLPAEAPLPLEDTAPVSRKEQRQHIKDATRHAKARHAQAADGEPAHPHARAVSSTQHVLKGETWIPEMHAIVKELVDAATGIRHELEKLALAAQETCRRSGLITGSVSHAAMSASQIDGAANEIAEAAEKLEHYLTLPPIDGDTHMATLTAALRQLNDTADRMEHTAPVITNLANQMNLLALNATIEAARAGDAGTGFAVIASELKALAGHAAQATEAISEQLDSARDVSDRTLESLRSALQVVEKIIRRAADVQAMAERQKHAAGKVVRNIAHTESGIRELTGIVGTVEQGADDTAAAVKHLQHTTVMLHRHIAALNEKVEGWIETLHKA